MTDAIRTFTSEKQWLWGWTWEYYGAFLDVDVYFYPYESKFCGEGELTYARIVDIAEGEVCAVRNEDGEFTIWGNAEIKIAGKPVARGKFNIRLYWDRTNGWVYLRKIRLDICGTNTFELKCTHWEEEYSFNGAKQNHRYLPHLDTKDVDEKALMLSLLMPRQRVSLTERSSLPEDSSSAESTDDSNEDG